MTRSPKTKLRQRKFPFSSWLFLVRLLLVFRRCWRHVAGLHRFGQILEHDLFLSGDVAVHDLLDLRGRYGLEFAEVGIDAVRISINHGGLAERVRLAIHGLTFLQLAGEETVLRLF